MICYKSEMIPFDKCSSVDIFDVKHTIITKKGCEKVFEKALRENDIFMIQTLIVKGYVLIEPGINGGSIKLAE